MEVSILSQVLKMNLVHTKNFLSAWLPPLLWAGLIFIFSSQSVLPGLQTSSLDFVFKKLAHITVYGILYFLIYRAVMINLKPNQKKSPKYYLVPFAVLLLYAASDEIHQHFVPGRHATLRDVGYDLLGGFGVFLKIHGYI